MLSRRVLWNGLFATMRSRNSVRSSHSHVLLAPRTCWLWQWMGTGNIIVSASVGGITYMYLLLLIIIIYYCLKVIQIQPCSELLVIECTTMLSMCSSSEPGYFDGVFIQNDTKVASSVENIHTKSNHVSVCVFVNIKSHSCMTTHMKYL